MLPLLLLLLGCPSKDDDTAPGDTSLQSGDCTATYGDNCSCEARCLTAEQIAAIDEYCDLDCDVSGEGITWTCDVTDGECVVVPAR